MDMEMQHRFENLKDGIDEVSKDLNGFTKKTNKSVETILENQKQLGEQMTALSGQLTAMSHFMGMHQMGGGHFPMRVQKSAPVAHSEGVAHPMFTGQHTIAKENSKPWEVACFTNQEEVLKASTDYDIILVEKARKDLHELFKSLKESNNSASYQELCDLYEDIKKLDGFKLNYRLPAGMAFTVRSEQGYGAFIKMPTFSHVYEFFFITDDSYKVETTEKLLKMSISVPCSDIIIMRSDIIKVMSGVYVASVELKVDYYK